MYNFSNCQTIVAFGIFSLLLYSTPLFGQSTEEQAVEAKSYDNVLAIVPQYAGHHGIRFDYERRLKGGDQWLVLAPQIYSDITSNNYYWGNSYSSYESMIGFGLNSYYKLAVFKSAKRNRSSDLPRHMLYFAAGPNFQYFSLNKLEEVPHSFIEDGVTYYKFNLEEVNKPIYRFGIIADVGWQLVFDRFVMDIYLGLAAKYSFDQDWELIRASSGWISPAYSGVLMDGGVKFGFFF